MKASTKSARTAVRPAFKRKHVRFKPDPGAYAEIQWGPGKSEFQVELVALVVEESFKGCGLVVVHPEALRAGSRLRIRIGTGPIISGEVKWSSSLDGEVMRIGILYLE